jgi:hypothetical protein
MQRWGQLWPWSYRSWIINNSYAISIYRHWYCEFESRSGLGVQHYVIKFVSDLRQVGGFLQLLRFPPLIKLTARYNWNIVESGVKYHKTNKHTNKLSCRLQTIWQTSLNIMLRERPFNLLWCFVLKFLC